MSRVECSSNCFLYGSYLDSSVRELEENRDEILYLFQMGRCLRFVRAASFCIRSNVILRISLRAMVGAGMHGADLFRKRVLEY
jgi:hypothetical protein